MRTTIRWSSVFVMLLITAVGCGDDGEPEGANEEVFTASFSVRDSIEQLHITHAAPGTALGLYTTSGDLIDEGSSRWHCSVDPFFASLVVHGEDVVERGVGLDMVTGA